MTLPTDYDERKALPLYTFLTEYFFLAFLEVVRVAVAGDKQHLNNPGTSPIRWAREKSTDQMNTAMRHICDYGTGQKYDVDGRAHLAKAIWRLSAQLQLDEEARLGPPTGAPAYQFTPEPGDRLYGGADIGIRAGATLAKSEPDGDTHMPPIEVVGFRAPVAICPDCGVDLNEGVHSANCLRFDVTRHW